MSATAFWFGMVVHPQCQHLTWMVACFNTRVTWAGWYSRRSSGVISPLPYLCLGETRQRFCPDSVGLLLRLLLLCLLLHLKTRFLLSPVAAELTTNINLNLNCNSHRTLYTISHTLITTLCVSMYERFHIKLIQRTRSLQNLTCWNSKSIWIMSSVITCAVITWTPTCFNGVCMYG